MVQSFPPVVNTVSRALVLGALLLAGAVFWAGSVLWSSPYGSGVGNAPIQPVEFSHEVHVGGLGLDCRYCHTLVEEGPMAGLPPTKTCMACHSQILTESPALEPVRRSYEEDHSIPWVRVHDLPDFAHFDHGIHVAKGVGCSSCHGRVDRMPRIRQGATLEMNWCLRCHRHPEEALRPTSRITDPTWEPPADQEERGRELARRNRVAGERLTNCSTCHQ